MIKLNYLLIILIFFVFHACKNKENTHNEQEIDSLFKERLSKYINKVNIPYLLKDEMDSLQLNIDKLENDDQYRIGFIEKSRKRRKEVNTLKRYLSRKKDVPASFKYYLLPEELLKFNSDSISDLITYNELYKERKHIISNISRHIHLLEDKEIQQLIQDSFKDSIYFKDIANKRHKKDSISYWTANKKRKDSLQSIVYPVSSTLPFGPESLGKLIANGQKEISFSIYKDSVPNAKNLEARNTIYNTWQYFLKFHPNDEDYDAGGYLNKALPPIKSYEFITIDNNFQNLLKENEAHRFNPKNGNFVTRLTNIYDYEVYYATTGIDSYDNNCGAGRQKEEECCSSGCSSIGYLILYDRKEQHSILISAFTLLDSYGHNPLNQFFYISKDKTIHIYKVWTDYNYDSSGDSKHVNEKYSARLNKTASINILSNENLIVNEECILHDGIKKEAYYSKGLNSVSEKYRHNEKWFSTKRDSVINKIQPLVLNYPLGSPALKQLDAFKGNLKLLDSTFKFYQFPGNKEKLHSFYTLPFTTKLNKINIGLIEHWNKGVLQNLQKSWICSNIEFDGDDINDYKLPAIGNYEAYLSIYNDYDILKGILILYNPTSKVANIINVLDDDNDSNFRFFYINSGNEIEIYQGYNNTEKDIKGLKSNSMIKIEKTHVVKISGFDIQVFNKK